MDDYGIYAWSMIWLFFGTEWNMLHTVAQTAEERELWRDIKASLESLHQLKSEASAKVIVQNSREL